MKKEASPFPWVRGGRGLFSTFWEMMVRRWFWFSYDSKADKVSLKLSGARWYWDVPQWIADRICALSGHRLCCTWMISWTYELVDKHTVYTMSVPSTKELWVEWAKAAGEEDPSWWWTDEEDDSGESSI